MPKYRYTATAPGGKQLSGEMIAASESDLRQMLARIHVEVASIEILSLDDMPPMPDGASDPADDVPTWSDRVMALFFGLLLVGVAAVIVYAALRHPPVRTFPFVIAGIFGSVGLLLLLALAAGFSPRLRRGAKAALDKAVAEGKLKV